MVRKGCLLGTILVPVLGLLYGTAAAAPQDCFGARPTISAGGGDNVINGTSGDDVIVGGGGDDVISGGGGDDLICGGTGADKISGGTGNDRLSGGASEGDDDTITFRSVSRGVRVDLGAGTATAESNDEVYGFEIVIGSRYDDVLIGSSDAAYELLRGKAGDDTLRAKAAITTMYGDRGHDTLLGGPGEDDFFGGPGKDRIDGAGGGLDVLMYWYSRGPVTVDVGAGTATGEGRDTFSGIDAIFGSRHDDTMRGSGGPDTLNGDEGDDVVRGAGGDDTLYGDVGNDRIFGGEGDDRLDGQGQRDSLDGGAGTDECLNGEEQTDCE